MYFVVSYKYNAAADSQMDEAEIKTIFKNHVRYLKQLYEDKKLFMAGPFAGMKDGIVVLETETAGDASEIMGHDPALESNLFSGTLYEWQVGFKR
ncbi:MAG TPA: YciI family protein [Syntrophales bacterium]|jgi:uncharacterized protein YciI|nr:YciI family protein [Syntrophales bacterium]HPX55805.1 YciI family protein [Syntrophales bacterium]HQA82065.1 YciI family protein [Syntrophales bacterium]